MNQAGDDWQYWQGDGETPTSIDGAAGFASEVDVASVETQYDEGDDEDESAGDDVGDDVRLFMGAEAPAEAVQDCHFAFV